MAKFKVAIKYEIENARNKAQARKAAMEKDSFEADGIEAELVED